MPVNELWTRGTEIVSRHKVLVFLPLLLDFLVFGGLAFFGSPVTAHQVKLAIPTSLPSILNLLPDIVRFTSERAMFTALRSGAFLQNPAVMVRILLSFIFIPFLNGGYLGIISQEISGLERKDPFFKMASHYFTRFLLVTLLITFVPMLLLYPAFLISDAIGIVFLSTLAIFTFLLSLFWDFSVVHFDLQVFQALGKVVFMFRNHAKVMIRALIPLVIMASVLSWLTALFLGTIFLFAIMIVYAYLAAVLVSGLMSYYVGLAQATTNK